VGVVLWVSALSSLYRVQMWQALLCSRLAPRSYRALVAQETGAPSRTPTPFQSRLSYHHQGLRHPNSPSFLSASSPNRASSFLAHLAPMPNLPPSQGNLPETKALRVRTAFGVIHPARRNGGSSQRRADSVPDCTMSVGRISMGVVQSRCLADLGLGREMCIRGLESPDR